MLRNDFVSNSSSSSFVFVVKDYEDIIHCDSSTSFTTLIRYRTQNCLHKSGFCKIVSDEKFLETWWLNNDWNKHSYYEICEGQIEILPKSLIKDLINLGFNNCSKDSLIWSNNKDNEEKVIQLLIDFINKHKQNWLLCEFNASDHEGETEIREEDGWDNVPSNCVWSTSINYH